MNKGRFTLLAVLSIALGTLGALATFSATPPPAPPEGAAKEELFRRFGAYAEKGMKEWGTPGMAVVVVRGDDVLYERAYGVKELGEAGPVTPSTLFQVGSTSKAFTSALVGMLVDEGKVKWDDRVADIMPDFKMQDPWVTREFRVSDLCAQRSGLPTHSLDTMFQLGFTRAQIVASLSSAKPVTSFRSEFAYQNALFLAAAALVEKVTGKTWEENVRQRIFTPLGMGASSMDAKAYREAVDVASLHSRDNGAIRAIPMDWPYMDWVYVAGPAGGINSTIRDMAKWARFQAGDGTFGGARIMKAETLAFLHSPKTILAPVAKEHNQYYCEGWVYREDSPFPIVWHNGGTSGHKTMVAVIPQARLGVVVLSDLDESQLPEALAFWFFDRYFGNPERDWSTEMLADRAKAEAAGEAQKPKPPAATTSPLSLEKYEGEYRSAPYGTVSVVRRGDALLLIAGPGKVEFALKPWDRDVFHLEWPGAPWWEAGFVTFKAGPESAITGFTSDLFDQEGCGTFERAKG